MTSRTFPPSLNLFAVLMLGAAILTGGCDRGGKLPARAATVVGSQVAKDETVVSAANRIDAVAPQPEVKVETDTIRNAVESAPAAEVEKLVADQQARITELENSAVTRVKLTLFGISALAIIGGALLAFWGQQPRAGMSLGLGGAAVFATGIAYEWAQRHQTLVGCVVVGCIVAAAALAYANNWHKKNG